jgi:hypothetical protein
MSQISVIVDETEIDVAFLQLLHRTTGIPLLEIKKKIKENKPILLEEIFKNDHEVVHEKIEKILSLCSKFNIGASIFEIPDNVVGNVQDLIPSEKYKIDKKTLLNFFQAWDKGY